MAVHWQQEFILSANLFFIVAQRRRITCAEKTKMNAEEEMIFIELLFAHRHLWMTFQEYRYLQEHPEMDWETTHRIFHEESDEVYNSLADALRERQPIRDKLRTVLLQSHLTEVEVRDQMKKAH